MYVFYKEWMRFVKKRRRGSVTAVVWAIEGVAVNRGRRESVECYELPQVHCKHVPRKQTAVTVGKERWRKLEHVFRLSTEPLYIFKHVK